MNYMALSFLHFKVMGKTNFELWTAGQGPIHMPTPSGRDIKQRPTIVSLIKHFREKPLYRLQISGQRMDHIDFGLYYWLVTHGRHLDETVAP